jgi:hypothetical protein
VFQLLLDCPVNGSDDDVGVTLSSPSAIFYQKRGWDLLEDLVNSSLLDNF